MKKLNAIKFKVEFNLLNIRRETLAGKKPTRKYKFTVDLKVKNQLTTSAYIRVFKNRVFYADNTNDLLDQIFGYLNEKIVLRR